MSLKANGYVETARAPLSGTKGGEDAYRHVEGGGVGEGAQGLVTPRQTWHHHFVLSVMHTTKKRFS